MPWRERSVMDERMRFVARRLTGEPMADLCREFGISRKTGYKIVDRYQECGIHGLTDRSRRPFRYANQLPFQVETYILTVKREHSSRGARKIRERLTRRFSGIPIPARSTIHAVLDRHGLVARRGRIRRRAQGTSLSLGHHPNDVWGTDYKGEFRLGNHHYCYPLTVTDHASRLLLACEALPSTKETYAFTVFERLFHEHGLPANIRSDNGLPFSSAHALFQVSRLAVWWLRLGIGIERIQPGHPQQNGRHERVVLEPMPARRTVAVQLPPSSRRGTPYHPRPGRLYSTARRCSDESPCLSAYRTRTDFRPLGAVQYAGCRLVRIHVRSRSDGGSKS
jgi:transposase InsO family protein